MHHFSAAETKPSAARLVTVESVYAQIREKRRLQDLESVKGYHPLEKKRRLQLNESVESSHPLEKKRRLQFNESVKSEIPVLKAKKKLQTTPDLVRVHSSKLLS